MQGKETIGQTFLAWWEDWSTRCGGDGANSHFQACTAVGLASRPRHFSSLHTWVGWLATPGSVLPSNMVCRTCEITRTCGVISSYPRIICLMLLWEESPVVGEWPRGQECSHHFDNSANFRPKQSLFWPKIHWLSCTRQAVLSRRVEGAHFVIPSSHTWLSFNDTLLWHPAHTKLVAVYFPTANHVLSRCSES